MVDKIEGSKFKVMDLISKESIFGYEAVIWKNNHIVEFLLKDLKRKYVSGSKKLKIQN